jgi:iron complex transport system ATP-binding protein
MQPPLEGEVLIEGRSIRNSSPQALARTLSVVLTDRISIGLLTVYDLVAIGRHPYTSWSGALSEHDHQIVRASLEAAGVLQMASRLIGELSDGERQRVMIARAMAQEPQLMVLDEVTAFLDLPHRVEAMRILRDLAHDGGRAILVSTHDLELALRTADRVWLLEKGGSLHSGAPEDLILNGAFESAFSGEGISFERHSGSFELPRAALGRVELSGEGLVARWTARALERLGYSVEAQSYGCEIRVEVSECDQGVEWRSFQGNVQRVHSSLEELTASLRSLRSIDHGGRTT